jgi:hypothetical protein
MKKSIARIVAAAALIGGVAIGLSGIAHAETVGDPDDMAGWHVAQTYDDCALMATADVVGQMTGDAPSEDEIISYAQSTPSVAQPGDMIYHQGVTDDDPDAGTIFKDLPIVLAHYGVDGHYVGNSNMDALMGVLRDGGAVIVNLNSQYIWGGDGQKTEADHALVVTGVDTDNDIVHMNDSGTEDGANEQVSIETFTAAWQTSGNEMVVTG